MDLLSKSDFLFQHIFPILLNKFLFSEKTHDIQCPCWIEINWSRFTNRLIIILYRIDSIRKSRNGTESRHHQFLFSTFNTQLQQCWSVLVQASCVFANNYCLYHRKKQDRRFYSNTIYIFLLQYFLMYQSLGRQVSMRVNVTTLE